MHNPNWCICNTFPTTEAQGPSQKREQNDFKSRWISILQLREKRQP